jgi:uncharacterized cupredoxin-like copper-binding protein
MLKRFATIITALAVLTRVSSAAYAQHEHHQMTDDDYRALAKSLSSHGPVIPQPAMVVTPTATKSFTITASAINNVFKFTVSPSPFTVNQGDTVNLTFTVPSNDQSANGGLHGLLMDTYFDNFTPGAQQPFNVKKGQSVTKTFVATTANTFGFVCNVSSCGVGHSNMTGTFTVTPNANPAPTINSLNPSNGTTSGGTAVTIGGTNFASGATVTFGGTAATTVNVASSTSITAVTPAHAAGEVPVTVANPDSQSATMSPGFTYNIPPPIISGINPASGPPTGGQTVTISGTGFVNGDTVTLGGTSATSVNVVSATTITAVTPAHAAGKVDVVVAHADGSSFFTFNGGYEYGIFTPTVVSISPNTGPTSGGTAVTITGTRFQPGATVTFGGLPATSVVVVNSTTITARTPFGPSNDQVSLPVAVTVTNPDSTSASASIFTYSVPPLAVLSLEPPAGPLAGGNTVTILGAGFTSAVTSSVKMGGVSATNVQVVNAVTINVTAPPHAAGPVDVVVTVGTSTVTATNAYVYSKAPSKRRSVRH